MGEKETMPGNALERESSAPSVSERGATIGGLVPGGSILSAAVSAQKVSGEESGEGGPGSADTVEGKKGPNAINVKLA